MIRSLAGALIVSGLVAGCIFDSTGPGTPSYQFVRDTTIGSGLRYYTVAITPGGVAFVTRPSAAKLARFDLATLTLDTAFAALGDQANGISLNAAGTVAYVANQYAGTLSSISTASGSTQSPAPTGENPYQTIVGANDSRVVVTGSSDSLLVFTTAGVLERRIGVATAPFGVARRPNGEILVTHLGSGAIWKVNATLTAAARLDSLKVPSANGIAVSTDGASAYVASEAGNVVVRISAATGDSLAAVVLPHPWGVAVTPDGSEVWVTSTAGKVYAISAATLAVRDSIFLGGTPRGIAIHSGGKGAIVVNEYGTLTLLH